MDFEMLVCRDYRAAHFETEPIPVEFVVLHYTAQSLDQTLKIFLSPESAPVSCHLLIDEKGNLYELVNCWEGPCYKAFHAGKSHFVDSEGKQWKNFNHFSLGIEIVNWNGNLFPFNENQYQSLFSVLEALKAKYPALQNPHRILGHEHIAGFRGKKDPGYLFDWQRLFESVYYDQKKDQEERDLWLKSRSSVLTEAQCHSLLFLSNRDSWSDLKAKQISLVFEKAWPFWLKKLFFRYLKMLWAVFQKTSRG